MQEQMNPEDANLKWLQHQDAIKDALEQAIKEALESYVQEGGDLKELPWFNVKKFDYNDALILE
jgi:hypothetical protein